MRRTTAVASASAAVLCLGAILFTGSGSTAGRSYLALGAAGPTDSRAPTQPVPPRDGVELTPLDGGDHGGGGEGDVSGGGGGGGSGGSRGDSGAAGGGGSPRASGSPGRPGAPGTSAVGRGGSTGGGPTGSPNSRPSKPSSPSGTPGGASGGGSDGDGNGSPGTGQPPGTPAPTTPPDTDFPTIPAGPNAPVGLLIGEPVLAGTDVRRCEQVSLNFLNTAKTPVTSGTVTFGTHVIGLLGVDWATVNSTHSLPLPLAPGRRTTGTWRVCVAAWRVPLGMHIETRDVTFGWK
ncbi:hypothetical protein GTY53_31765 [Streptomyces sp. SID7805]|nr:hypothetical protein [Streptomyces sp. SID7805]